jgi:hypothetical protein
MKQPTQLLARIAALQPADRRWLLARASPAVCTNIAVALGAPVANELSADRAGSVEDSDPWRVIAAASAADVLEVLRDESSWLIATVFRLSDWPWKEALAQRLTPLQRPMMAVGGVDVTPKIALATALLRRMANRLPSIRSAPPVPSKFEELVEQFHRFRRRRELPT